ncbi:MAG: hypothetical protein WCO30_00565 [bacterium]
MVLHEFAGGTGTSDELEVALEEYTSAKHCARHHAIKRLLKSGWLEGVGEGDEVRFMLTEKAYGLMIKHGLRERKNAETIKSFGEVLKLVEEAHNKILIMAENGQSSRIKAQLKAAENCLRAEIGHRRAKYQ